MTEILFDYPGQLHNHLVDETLYRVFRDFRDKIKVMPAKRLDDLVTRVFQDVVRENVDFRSVTGSSHDERRRSMFQPMPGLFKHDGRALYEDTGMPDPEAMVEAFGKKESNLINDVLDELDGDHKESVEIPFEAYMRKASKFDYGAEQIATLSVISVIEHSARYWSEEFPNRDWVELYVPHSDTQFIQGFWGGLGRADGGGAVSGATKVILSGALTGGPITLGGVLIGAAVGGGVASAKFALKSLFSTN
jgi:hypothetical protein